MVATEEILQNYKLFGICGLFVVFNLDRHWMAFSVDFASINLINILVNCFKDRIYNKFIANFAYYYIRVHCPNAILI